MDRKFTAARNTLILMVLIDHAAYTVIFPIIPELMVFYLKSYFHVGIKGSSELVIGGFTLTLSDLSVILGGAITSLWAILQFFSAPFWGRLSDRMGRRKILTFCALSLSAAHVIWGFATSLPLFILYRVLGGIMGGNVSAAHAAMADITAPEERTRHMGLLGAAGGIGMILGPVIGGLLGHPAMQNAAGAVPFLHPFSLCAFASAALFAVNALFIARMPETLSRQRNSDTEEYTALNLARRSHLPGFPRLAALNFIFCFSMAGVELILPYFLKQRHDLSPSSIGLVFLFIGIVMALSQIALIPALMRRTREKGLIVAGFASVPIPLLLAVIWAPDILTAMWGILPVAAGCSLITPALMGAVSHISPPDRQGHLLGIFIAWGTLAFAAGPLVTAAFYGVAGLDATTVALALLFAAGSALAIGIRENTRSL